MVEFVSRQPDRAAPRRQRLVRVLRRRAGPAPRAMRPRGHPRVLPQRHRRADAAVRRERRSPASRASPCPRAATAASTSPSSRRVRRPRRCGRGRPLGRRAGASRDIKTTLESMNIHFDEWFSQASIEESGAVAETARRAPRQGASCSSRTARRGCAPTDFGDPDKDRVARQVRRRRHLPRRRHRLPPRQVRDPGLRPAHRRLGRRPPRPGARACRPRSRRSAYDAGRARGAARPAGLAGGGEPRLSKRAGNIVDLADIVDEVGPDAARLLTFLLQSIDTATDHRPRRGHVRKSMENPVFYVQYAHARIASIDRVAAERGVERLPLADVDLALLVHERELDCCARCPSCPRWSQLARAERAPHKVTTWVRELADRVPRLLPRLLRDRRGRQPELTQARLWLVEAAGSASRSASTCSACQRPRVDVSRDAASRRPAARHRRRRRRRPAVDRRLSTSLDLAAEFGTPLFVYDEDAPAGPLPRGRRGVRPTASTYATKAFLCRAMARLVARGGHAPRRGHRRRAARRPGRRRARRAPRAPRQQQVASTSCARPWTAGVGRIVVDSLRRARPARRAASADGLPRADGAAARHARRRGPHPRVRATGQDDSKFGFGLAAGDAAAGGRAGRGVAVGRARRAARATSAARCSRPTSSRQAVEVLAPFVDATTACPSSSLGGGLGVAYVEGEEAPTHHRSGRTCVLDACRRRAGVTRRVTAEPGRSIVAAAGGHPLHRRHDQGDPRHPHLRRRSTAA